MQQIRRSLVSVSDKSGIVELCRFLAENNVEVVSTGGTYKLLRENNINAVEISAYTGFPEMMDGRLKTLHPKIHGGLLNRSEDSGLMQEYGIENIDLVVVNLYPFEETLAKTEDYGTIIENIDIGGPSMVRSAAKNHKYKTVVTDSGDYRILIDHLKQNGMQTSFEFRRSMAGKAFALTAYYDAVIARYFAEKFIVDTDKITFAYKNREKLRYGENSHQEAFSYKNGKGFMNFTQHGGKELSYNNLNDSDAAFNIAAFFTEPVCAIIKHANPCGVALADNIEKAYSDAFSSDKTSAFGGIVAVNREVTGPLAAEIAKHFFEVIIAPNFAKEALEVLAQKKNLRLISVDFTRDLTPNIKSISGGILVQERDNVVIDGSSFEIKTGTMPNIGDLIFAFSCVRFLKSNAILITSGRKFVSFGCGQTSRIDAMHIALEKAKLAVGDLSSCILASDAFFPFVDNIEIAHQYGIKNIVAPSGSVKDNDVISAAQGYGINLIFAKTRHFFH